MLFFHGNSEDIGMTSNAIKIIASSLNISVLAIEFPGYGLYQG